MARVWQLQPAGDSQPGVVYAGVEPAALFRSDDEGESFPLDEGLWGHPHRPQWNPGGGGLCLHTVLPDPAGGPRLAVAVSAAGFYRTLDGSTWEAANPGIRAPFLPEPTPEFGQCVHKVDRHPSHPDTLFLQHHWGVYRSDDFGGHWDEVGERSCPRPSASRWWSTPTGPAPPTCCPSRRTTSGSSPTAAAGLPHRRRRRVVDGVSDGLPQEDAYLSVLRDGFGADPCDPTGLYLGTRTGDVFASADGGESWTELARHLPPVLCVKAAVLR